MMKLWLIGKKQRKKGIDSNYALRLFYLFENKGGFLK